MKIVVIDNEYLIDPMNKYSYCVYFNAKSLKGRLNVLKKCNFGSKGEIEFFQKMINMLQIYKIIKRKRRIKVCNNGHIIPVRAL